jgi:L-arabinonolactonase
MKYYVEHVLSLNNGLGESPLWHVSEQALYWINHPDAQFFKFIPATGDYEIFQLEDKPGCMAFQETGELIMATTKGLGIWKGGQLHYLKNAAYNPPARFNDGAVDWQGRFWAGTASDTFTNHLYRLDHDGGVQIMESGVSISNGIGWSPDSKTMYYSDSGGAGIVYAYDFDPATGAIDNRRTFLPPTGTSAVADGLTVDSEGCIWTAYWDGWKIARYDPGGQLMAEIKMPVQRPTSCMFGGPALDELYITSASIDIDKNEQPLSGDLFKIKTDVKGLPEPIAKINAQAIAP